MGSVCSGASLFSRDGTVLSVTTISAELSPEEYLEKNT